MTEGTSNVPPPAPVHEEIPPAIGQDAEPASDVGSYVDLMTDALANLQPLSLQEIGLERVEEVQDTDIPPFPLRGASPVRTTYKQVVSVDDDVQELNPK